MKTNGFYASVTSGKRVVIASLIVALLLASLPVFSVFAAPAPQENTDEQMERDWRELLVSLQGLNTYYNTMRLKPSDFEKLSDLERANGRAEKMGIALRKAQAVVATHVGFDSNGNVLNSRKAAKTILELKSFLGMARGFKNQLRLAGAELTVNQNDSGANNPTNNNP